MTNSSVDEIAKSLQSASIRDLQLYNYGEVGAKLNLCVKTSYDQIMQEYAKNFPSVNYDLFFAGYLTSNVDEFKPSFAFYVVKPLFFTPDETRESSGWSLNEMCWAALSDKIFYPAKIIKKDTDKVTIKFFLFNYEGDCSYDCLYKYDDLFFVLATDVETQNKFIMEFKPHVTAIDILKTRDLLYPDGQQSIVFSPLYPYYDMIQDLTVKQLICDSGVEIQVDLTGPSLKWRRDEIENKILISVCDIVGKDYCLICDNSNLRDTPEFHITNACPKLYRCVHCGQHDHFASDCKNKKESKSCARCFKQGHVAANCPNAFVCRYCFFPGHLRENCPYWQCKPAVARAKHEPGTIVAGIVLTDDEKVLRKQIDQRRADDYLKRYAK